MRRLFKRAEDGPERWIVVGLGNPGERYAGTRHNAGVLVVEELVERTGSRLKSHRSSCLVAEARLVQEPVVLARPTDYMNNSGRPVRQLLSFYKAPIERLIVVHDEIDLPFGDLRLKAGGGTAGHNGLKSVASHLGSKEFLRVRVGVGRPRGSKQAADHVLDTFSGAERKELPELIDRAADAVERVVEAGVERAMNEVNTRTEKQR